jgi:hypothetical protein
MFVYTMHIIATGHCDYNKKNSVKNVVKSCYENDFIKLCPYQPQKESYEVNNMPTTSRIMFITFGLINS